MITPIQRRHALALADAHCHWWARYPAHFSTDVLSSAERIADTRRRLEDLEEMDLGYCYGGVVPYADERGRLVHLTGTGRLSWAVGPHGLDEVIVERPQGVCITVRVRGRRVEITLGEARALTRHVDALNGVLRAVGLAALPSDHPVLTDDRDSHTPASREALNFARAEASEMRAAR